MTQNIQVSTKLGDGAIYLIAGGDAREFYDNAIDMVGETGAAELKAGFMNLIPVAGGSDAPINRFQPRQAPSEAPPGGATVCPSHGQAAVWKPGGTSQAGKAYDGFWKCAVTGSSISNFGGNGLKSSCPPPRSN